MVSLSCKYHRLIQFLISFGPPKEKEFHSIFTGITGRNPGAAKKIFDNYLTHTLFELRACGDGHVCNGVVVNNVSNDQSKLRTKYSVPQTAFFKGVIDAIVQDEAARGWISGFEALNIRLENQLPSEASNSQQQVPPAFKNFSMSQKDKTLDELLNDIWLCRTRDGNIGLDAEKIFDKYLLEISKELSYVHFELRACRDQYDGYVCYGLVNTVSDDQSKLGTTYSVPQIAFFKGIIEAIAHDEAAQGCISGFDALNIRLENQLPSEANSSQQQVPTVFKNFSMSQKDKTLEELVKDNWLCRTRDGNNIGLGIRSLLDLRSWFRNNDVPSCQVCNEAGVKADLCPNEGCTVRIHKYYLKNLLSQRDDRVCSGCGKPWPLGRVAKEEAVEAAVNDDDEEETDTQATALRSKKRKNKSHRDSAENVSSQASLASSIGTTRRRVTRSAANLS